MSLRTLSKRSEFLAANRGLRFPMPGFVLLVRPRGDSDETLGVGYTVSKKVGNAVTRNRMKRRFRELARAAMPSAGISGADLVLIGRPAGNDIAFAELGEHVDSALKRAAEKLAKPSWWPRRSDSRVKLRSFPPFLTFATPDLIRGP